MSSAGVIRFGVCVALAAVWWLFLAPVIDSLAILEPMGEIVSQQRLDTQAVLVLGFKVSPLIVLLAVGIQFWATSLRRSDATVRGISIRTVTAVYVAQITLLVLCICLGPVIDMIMYEMMMLPAVENTYIPYDLLYTALGWFYPLLVIIMIAVYVALFISVAKELDYEVRGALQGGGRRKSDFF